MSCNEDGQRDLQLSFPYYYFSSRSFMLLAMARTQSKYGLFMQVSDQHVFLIPTVGCQNSWLAAVSIEDEII